MYVADSVFKLLQFQWWGGWFITVIKWHELNYPRQQKLWQQYFHYRQTLGRVLPLYWVIWMCHRFDPLFWHSGDWTRSFWGTFSHPLTPKRSFGSVKTTNPYRIRSFWPQILFFPRSFGVQFSAASGTHPSFFGPSTPTGRQTSNISPMKSPNLNVSGFVLKLYLPTPLKPVIKLRMISNFIAY